MVPHLIVLKYTMYTILTVRDSMVLGPQRGGKFFQPPRTRQRAVTKRQGKRHVWHALQTREQARTLSPPNSYRWRLPRREPSVF